MPTLHDDAALLRGLIDAIQEFIVLKDGEGRWLHVNQAVIDVYGLQGIDYHGLTDGDMQSLRPELAEAFGYNLRTDEMAWQQGAALTVEKSLTGPDGQLNTWEVVKTPSFDEQGRRDRLVIVSRNVTERKRAEAARRRAEHKSRLITENMSDVIALIDGQGDVRYVSPSLRQALGRAPERSVGRPAAELVNPMIYRRCNAPPAA